ncbi:MAG: hypothetical protein HYV67_02760 [Candidatus Taylorbacteria bacterium]|nr:hypothetical protein [Candidatus Taylorbacteria bacterium]
MDIPKDYLNKFRGKQSKITSERQELIQRFTDKINVERVGTAFKPATWKQINGLLAHLKVRDLYWFLGECGRAPSFSKKFFGVLKGARKRPKTKT